MQPAVGPDIGPSDGQTDPMAATKVDSKKREKEISMASLPWRGHVKPWMERGVWPPRKHLTGG